MQIKFSVEYFYRPAAPESERFNASVRAFLPKAPGKEYISACYLGKLGDDEIRFDSGFNTKGFREIFTEFCAGSLEELDRIIENAIEDYRRQVQLTVEIAQKTPISREIIKDFPDPIEEAEDIVTFYTPDPDDPDL